MSEPSSAIESGTLGGGLNETKPRLKIASEKTGKLDQLTEKCGEWCSSILIKETRQALKSRQFIWTYIVLLLAVGMWTVVGLSMSYSQYEVGKDLLYGYWVILGFPLGIIIPFTAYRSLAREFEDGTINLISITTMKPHQIVIGKFGSALLQMLIYLSILAPCICFTYMLRGISIDQITMGLMIGVGGSVCLTVLGLFLAGVFRSKALGIGVSVLFVLLLGWLYFLWCMITYEMVQYNFEFEWDDPDFVTGFFGVTAFFGSTAVLLLVAASSQISFASDNRSTGIRIAMFVQQILFFAMIVMFAPIFRSSEFVWGMSLFFGHYWLFMGLLMIGESSTVTRRVQRTLPRETHTRSLFSLFMPGSGRGFLFAIANLWTCLVVLCLIGAFSSYLVDEETIAKLNSWGGLPGVDLGTGDIVSGTVSCFYVTWFLAVIYLVNLIFLAKRKPVWAAGVGPTVSLLLGAFMIAILSIGSAIIHYNYFYRAASLTPFLSLNWYMTSYEIQDGITMVRSLITLIVTLFSYLVFVGQALVVIGIAIAFASKELLVKPIEVPKRVQIEEQKPQKRKLPKGESIEEIFGELNQPTEQGG